MTGKVKCEIWIAMNEDGDWVVVQDESEALSQLAEQVGGYYARVAKVTVHMAPPSRQRPLWTFPTKPARRTRSKPKPNADAQLNAPLPGRAYSGVERD